MSIRMRLLSVSILLLFALELCSAQVNDAEAVKDKLFQAKKDYDAEVQKFKKAITGVLDEREDEARKSGNTKAVDQVKSERTKFEKTGELPSVYPTAFGKQITAARTNLDKAYTAAVKEYLILKLDDAAGATEKEQREFHYSSALLFGKRVYLVALKQFNVKVWNNTFANNGTFDDGKVKIKLNGEFVPHSIFLHPPDNGFSQVKYPLGGKWTVFRTTIGVPKINDKHLDPLSPLTFEVLGDDKSLWKSEAVTKMDAFQTCEISIEKVKTITLLVHCPDKNGWGCAYWFEPTLIE